MVTVINYEFFEKQIDEATKKANEDAELLFSEISEREIELGIFENDIKVIFYNYRAEIAGILINFGYEVIALRILSEIRFKHSIFYSDKNTIINSIGIFSHASKKIIKNYLGNNSFYFNTKFFDLEV